MGARLSNPQLSDPRSWYALERWRRLRRHQLRVEPLCRMCKACGFITVATVVDHVEPHRGDWAAFLIGKLQSLCNSDKHLIELGKKPRPRIDLDGMPIDK